MQKKKIIELIIGSNNQGKLKEIKDLLPKKLKIYTPKINCYIGNTLKFFKKKYKINFTNILKNNLKEYNEIILVGSGKGVTSVKEIVDTSWKRSSFKIFNKLYKTLENEKTK